MKVSLVYCTARHGGLDILDRSVEDQTHTLHEVIVVDELRRKEVVEHKLGFRYVEPPAKKPEMFWNLSASLNAACKAATGDLIVLLQDYIYVPPFGIERYVKRFEQEPKSIITGVGHQYALPGHIDDRLGGYSIWNWWPGVPRGQKTFIDPRAEKNGFYLTIPVEWEANWGAFPRQAWLDVGGFDEGFDAGWGYDNVNFAERCQMADYHIWLDTENEVLCYDHIRIFGEQKRRAEAPNNQRLWASRYSELSQRIMHWKLGYAQ